MLKTKYKIINENGERKVKVEGDKLSKKIMKDDNGKEYFSIRNPYADKSDVFGMFTRKIKDAITAIRENYAHALIQSSSIFGIQLDRVCVFLDEEYGQELRKKTIEGWKDTKFGYSICYGYTNSMSSPRYVLTDNTTAFAKRKGIEPYFFDTEGEAQEKINELIAEANKIQEEYNKIEKGKKEKYLEDNYVHNIIWDMFFSMNETDCQTEDEKKATYVIEVSQICKK